MLAANMGHVHKSDIVHKSDKAVVLELGAKHIPLVVRLEQD
jgi:hypothetical protein